jgi:2-polyprenyl-6-methoxyphenol hydroxylase-like FAD-dependent oxidoreductase
MLNSDAATLFSQPASRGARPAAPLVIVGGRCAGSAAAIALAGVGYQVLLVERARMPSDTLSTHLLWPDGVAALARLGVLEEVLATGAPPLREFQLWHGNEVVTTRLSAIAAAADDGASPYDYCLSVRRIYLDGILWEAARRTPGVTVRDRTSVTALRWEDGVVRGVELAGPRGRELVDSALVVGADGRGSFVARAVGAVEDAVVPAGRYWYFGYFEEARLPDPPVIVDSETDIDSVFVMPTNDEQVVVLYGAFNEDFNEFRRDHRASYLARIQAHPHIRALLEGARLVTPVYGFAGVRGYYRDLYGPGWVLAGDAAHQKDPVAGRGVNDALRAGEWLAEALAEGISAEALARYAFTLRERTWTRTLTARMIARPDWHMTAGQGKMLATHLVTSEGLAGFLSLLYDDDQEFDDFFGPGSAEESTATL